MVQLTWTLRGWTLGLALAAGVASADPPPVLALRAAVTVLDGVVWFRPGELLVGDPGLPGRPAVRALAGEETTSLPAEPGDFEDLGAGCRDLDQDHLASAPVVLTRGDLGGDGQLEVVTIQRASPTAAPELRVLRGEQLVAQGSLPVPALPCRGLVAEVEPDGAPDLVVVWASRSADGTTVGVSIFALP